MEEINSAKIREAKSEKNSMDGDGLSSRDRSRIGRLWSGSDNDATTNDSSTHNSSTNNSSTNNTSS